MDLSKIKLASKIVAVIATIHSGYLFLKHGFTDIGVIFFVLAAILDFAYFVLEFATKHQNIFKAKKGFYDYFLIFSMYALMIIASVYITVLLWNYDIQPFDSNNTFGTIFCFFISLSTPNLIIVIIYYIRFSYLKYKPIIIFTYGSSTLVYIYLIFNTFLNSLLKLNFISMIFSFILSPFLLVCFFGLPILVSLYILNIPNTNSIFK